MSKTAIILTLTALIATYPQSSYGSDFENLVSGQQVPLAKSLKDLDNSWRQISISGQFEMGDFMKNWAGLFGGSSYNYVYYTQGKTVKVADETYVIAYRLPSTGQGLNMRTLMETTFSMGCTESSLPVQLKPETSLSLALLNIRTIGSLNDVRPFNLKEELAASEQQYQEAKTTCEQMPTQQPTETPNEMTPLPNP